MRPKILHREQAPWCCVREPHFQKAVFTWKRGEVFCEMREQRLGKEKDGFKMRFNTQNN